MFIYTKYLLLHMLKCEWNYTKEVVKYFQWTDLLPISLVCIISWIVGVFISLWLELAMFAIVVGLYCWVVHNKCKQKNEEQKEPNPFEKISNPFGAKIFYKPLQSRIIFDKPGVKLWAKLVSGIRHRWYMRIKTKKR